MNDHQSALSRIFDSRSRNQWSDKPVSEDLIHQLYDYVKFGPTSFNSAPARFHFCVSQVSRNRLAQHAMEQNKAKIISAPCVAIIATDYAFYQKMPKLFPERGEGIMNMLSANTALAESTAYRNSTLQGAYLIVAARLLGLDCGPMSGFNSAGVDEEFFAGTTAKSNFICALGYPSDEPFPRLPRLTFDDAAKIL